jgi:hypothetical protein
MYDGAAESAAAQDPLPRAVASTRVALVVSSPPPPAASGTPAPAHAKVDRSGRFYSPRAARELASAPGTRFCPEASAPGTGFRPEASAPGTGFRPKASARSTGTRPALGTGTRRAVVAWQTILPRRRRPAQDPARSRFARRLRARAAGSPEDSARSRFARRLCAPNFSLHLACRDPECDHLIATMLLYLQVYCDGSYVGTSRH